MAQAAVRLDEIVDMSDGSVVPSHEPTVVSLKPGPARPTLSVVPPSPELAGIMTLITKAANVLASEQERAALLDKRATEAEKALQAANRKLADTEVKLASAVDQAKTEKLRAAEVQRRSGELLEKTRTTLGQASDRMRAAEARAEKAETALGMVQGAMERQLAPLLG